MTLRTAAPVPAVAGRTWLGFLAGFTVLCGVLLGTSAIDATGRWGLAILAAVLALAVPRRILNPAHRGIGDLST